MKDNFIGYMTLYFRLESGGGVDYGKLSFDFSVCPTKEGLNDLLVSLAEFLTHATIGGTIRLPKYLKNVMSVYKTLMSTP